MSRELRANLIFVCILLVLSAPGFYILMAKRIAHTGPPVDLPDPVPHAVAYVQPDPVPPGLPRVEPPEARAWVEQLASEHGVVKIYRGADDEPMLSSDHRVQVVERRDAGAHTAIALIFWQEPSSAMQFVADARNSRGQVKAQNVVARSIAVPTTVRHALQRVGYIDPPDHVAWVTFEVELKIARLSWIDIAPAAHPDAMSSISFSVE